MKKTLNILSLLGILVASAWIGVVYSFETRASQTKASAIQEIASKDFPLNQPRFIDFQVDQESLKGLTERQQKNQFRDWLLFTIAYSNGFSTSEINPSFDRLPTFRYGYGKPLSELQYGDTRSLHLGDGRVVALLPKNSSKQERLENLAQIADRHRQDLGKVPTSLVVFEYDLNLERKFARVTRREVLDPKDFFTNGNYGYNEAQIKSLDDLRNFINQVDYITLAQVKDSTLTLGGRKLNSRKSPPIRLEDIATIWKSHKTIQSPGSSFSLEPSYDYRSLEKFLTKTEPSLRSLTSGNAPAITQRDIERAKVSLAQNNEIPYLALANKLAQSKNPAAAEQGKTALAQAIRNRFQVARYDAKLKGTEVGMLLFYTDLLAKLWAIDYLNNSPERDITDFQPPKIVNVSSTDARAIKSLSSIRIGFGVQDQGFQVAKRDKSLFLEPNATQMYAAAYDPLQPSASKTTTAKADAFLRWWNESYEEVLVQNEPQYERLDEIIKWGLLISWLQETKQSEVFNFLNTVPVSRNHWFPNWARANSKQLKFPIGNQVNFYQRGYKGTKTEAMPILASQVSKSKGKETTFVSGRVRIRFRPRPGSGSGSDFNPPPPKNPNLDIPTNRIPDLNSPPPKVNPVNAVDLAKEEVKFPNPETEAADLKFKHNVSSTVSGFQVVTNVNGRDLDSLNVTKTQNGFTVGWSGQDIIQEQSLVKTLDQDPTNLEAILNEHPNVEALVELSDEPPTYLVKMQHSNRWLKVNLTEGKPGSGSPPGRSYRIGGFGDNSRKITLAWVDEQTVKRQLAEGRVKPIRYDPVKLQFASLDDNLRDRRYDAIAEELATDPLKLEKHYNANLQQIDQLLLEKDYTEAAQHIDELIHFYGQKPDLIFRKGVVEVQRGRINVELVVPGKPKIGKEQSRKTFLDEVNALLAGRNNNVKFRTPKTDKAFFYVQDTPGLNNIDWNLPIDSSHPLIAAKASLYQLQPGDIGEVSLSAIGFGDTTAQLSNQADSADGFRPRYRKRNNEQCEPGKEQECCEQGMEQYCDQQSQQQKPIYIVISPKNT